MSVPNSVEELIQLIRKSGMIDETKLSNYMRQREFTRGLPPDVRDFAEEMVRDGIMTYFQSEQFLLGKWRGFTIGKYKLLERIGVGGMGQVFLCEHMFMRKRVAIKVLPPAKAEQPAALGRFYREARAAGSLEHSNIVRTHDIDQDGNLHFIVMDYVDGPNLLDVVKKYGQMDLGRAVSYTRQVAVALDYAFRNKIIHRDIKPGNVLIDRKGVARILDLGLARFINDHSDQLTLKYDDKIVLGTADYVAPEQVANSHSVDIRADIYAMGATFYFLLAGHPPFPTGTVSQKLLWHRTKEPTAIRSIRPDIPDGLAAIVAKMMAKDPRGRYQTPAQVVAELDAWLPSVVPLPNQEEMPQLSPAANEGVNVELEEQPSVEVAAETARTDYASATAVLAEPKATVAPPTPFGPSSGSPWGGSNGDDTPTSTRQPEAPPSPQAAVDTAHAQSEQTPSGHRRNPFSNANPFAGGDATEVPQTQKPWVLILAISAAVVLTLALIISRL
ncbi:MAG TPA: protein kinase [Gemmata sp.]|jgi:serine/threonine protein kinase|nr:protein kinase [Gemmata sp.]